MSIVNKTVTKTDNKTKLVIITVTKKKKDYFTNYNTRKETIIW